MNNVNGFSSLFCCCYLLILLFWFTVVQWISIIAMPLNFLCFFFCLEYITIYNTWNSAVRCIQHYIQTFRWKIQDYNVHLYSIYLLIFLPFSLCVSVSVYVLIEWWRLSISLNNNNNNNKRTIILAQIVYNNRPVLWNYLFILPNFYYSLFICCFMFFFSFVCFSPYRFAFNVLLPR